MGVTALCGFVARLSRGEPLVLVARQTNVSVAKLTEWRERAPRSRGKTTLGVRAHAD